MKKILFLIIFFSFSLNCGAEPLLINEIIPNPEGKDQSKEWIEIKNTSNSSVNLGDYVLNNGNKDSPLPQINISAGEIIVIDSFKYALKNSEAVFFLKHINGQTSDQLKFDKAPEGQSYSVIKIFKDNKAKMMRLWTSPSKNKENRTLFELSGSISLAPQISKDFFFEVRDESGKVIKIVFEEPHDYTTLKNVLPEGTVINILAEKKENHYGLLEYEIVETPLISKTQKKSGESKKDDRYLYLMIPIVLLILILIYLHSTKERP